MRQIEQDPMHVGMGSQDDREEQPVPSTHVNDFVDTAEIVRGYHRLRDLRREAGHRVVENGISLWRVRQEVEVTAAKDSIEGRLTGSHAAQQIIPGAVLL
jgi:hypothetical protein